MFPIPIFTRKLISGVMAGTNLSFSSSFPDTNGRHKRKLHYLLIGRQPCLFTNSVVVENIDLTSRGTRTAVTQASFTNLRGAMRSTHVEAEPGCAQRGEVFPPNDLHVESRMNSPSSSHEQYGSFMKYTVFVSLSLLVVSSHGREEAPLLVSSLKTNSSPFSSSTEGCIWLRMCFNDARHMQDPGFHPQHSYSRKELHGNFSV